jgi:ABC-type phosphate transport system substrate-binding protein
MRKYLVPLLLVALSVQAEVAVIANAKSNVTTLSAKQIQDIFLGRTRSFPNEKFALPIDQSSPLRAEFYQRLTGRPIEQINAYWARILFTGQASPPLQLPDDAAVLKMVRENEGAIGYINKSHVEASVRVLLTLP